MSRRTLREVCRQKKGYHTRSAALDAVNDLVKLGTAEGSIEAYRCRRCEAWHVGHVPGWRHR